MPAVLGGWVPAGGDDAGTTLPRYSTDVVVASMQAQQAGHSRQGAAGRDPPVVIWRTHASSRS